MLKRVYNTCFDGVFALSLGENQNRNDEPLGRPISLIKSTNPRFRYQKPTQNTRMPILKWHLEN
jgi:hypothetical protein